MQEYLSTYEKTDKNGKKYYYQTNELGIKGYEGYELLWSGIVAESEWIWANEVANEQPERVIMNQYGIICLKN